MGTNDGICNWLQEIFLTSVDKYMTNTVPSSEHLTVSVTGMTCASCVRRVEKVLLSTEGVMGASVNLMTNNAQIIIQPSDDDITDRLSHAISKIGYGLEFSDENEAMSWWSRVFSYQDRELRLMIARTIVGITAAVPILLFMISGLFMEKPVFADRFLLSDYPLREAIAFGLATISVFWVAAPIHRLTFLSARHRTVDMNTLISLGVGIAYFFSSSVFLFPDIYGETEVRPYFDAVAFIVALLLTGRVVEARARNRASDLLRTLVNEYPTTARVLEADGNEYKIPVQAVVEGEILLVRAGETIPLDGSVVQGESLVNEALITGESNPAPRTIGDQVIGGTVNLDGALQVEVSRVSSDGIYASIVQLIDRAQMSKSSIQLFADRVSAVFVPLVILLSLATFFSWWIYGPDPSIRYAFIASVTVLIIACPCALGLATPAALAVAIGRAAKSGILITDASAFQKIAESETICLDKTGTLTEGTASVSGFVLAQGSQASAQELLRIVASVERGSQHPFSLPFLDLASSQNLELVWPTTFRYFPGKGIMASVETELSEYSVLVGNISLLEDHGVEHSALVSEIEAMGADGLAVVLVAIDGKLSGVYGIKNAVKSGANRVVSELSNAGYRNILVSGDREEITRPFGLNLGISEIHSSMLPDDKAALVRELQIETAGSVVMIGDGMNDAPALAQADVGIAVVQASALAQSSATVNLLNSDLSQVNDLFRLSKRVVKVTMQNVLWAFLYNIVLLPVAAGAGYLIYLLVGSGDGGSPIPWLFSETWLLNPTAAAAAMALSSVSVVANSLRIQGFK